MARLRYLKSLEQVKRDAERNPEFLSSTVRSLRVVYETDRAAHAALVPRPLEPSARPEIGVTFSHVAMHISPDFTFEIGSAVFGARARYDGIEGLWLVTMPMTSEQAVLGGRDTYGEPKKIAQIQFQQEGERVAASVSRMGIAYLEGRGRLGASLGPRRFVEYGYTMKALPSCDPADKGQRFDADPLLVRLEWQHEHRVVRTVEGGELALRESPFDPVADLPVRRIVRMEYEEGTTQSSGRVLRSVPAEWLLPLFHQRYDDPGAQGVEIVSG
jgi:acetoacetate decarboxylase